MLGAGTRGIAVALARRLALGLLTIWLVASITFALVSAAPGDPVAALFGDDSDAEVQARAARAFGTDQSTATQYIAWMSRLVRLDLGTSVSFGAPVGEVILGRLATTFVLILPALLLSSAIAAALGLTTASDRSLWRKAGSVMVGAVLAAIPIYVLAHVLILIFSVKLSWFPMQGLRDPRSNATGIAEMLQRSRYLVLPILTLTLHQLVLAWLFMRARVREESRSVYLRTASAKGLTRWQVRRRHLWPNVRLGFTHFVAARLGGVLTGAVLVETVFGVAGMGRLIVSASLARDVPLVTGIFLCTSVLVVLANMAADVLTNYLDPRAGQEHRNAA